MRKFNNLGVVSPGEEGHLFLFGNNKLLFLLLDYGTEELHAWWDPAVRVVCDVRG